MGASSSEAKQNSQTQRVQEMMRSSPSIVIGRKVEKQKFWSPAECKWIPGKARKYISAEGRIQYDEAMMTKAGILKTIPDSPKNESGKLSM